jgi:competence protein ComEC
VRVPALLVAIPLLAGSAGAILLYENLGPQLAFLTAGAAAVAWLAGVAAASQGDLCEATAVVALGSLLAGVSLGATAVREASEPPILSWFDAAHPTETVIVQGVLRQDASPTQFGLSLTLDVISIGTPGGPTVAGRGTAVRSALGGVRLAVGGALVDARLLEWRAGRVLRAPALLRRPSTYLNPGIPDERRALARRGVALVGSIKSAALIDVVSRGPVLSEAAASIRAWVRRRMTAQVSPLDPASAGVATAVLIGDRSGLNVQDERRLQDAGTYHVIAISGGNIAVLAVLSIVVCRLLLIPSRAAAVATAAGLFFYGLIAASGASVSRAIAVAAIMLAARALDQRGSSLNAIAVAAAVGTASSPVIVFDAGFLLSFGATLGILLGVPPCAAAVNARNAVVRPGDRRRPNPLGILRWLRRAALLLAAATLCAEVTIAPIGATCFARVSFAGLLLNFAAIPMASVVQIGGLLAAICAGWCESVARLAAGSVHVAATALLQSAHLVDVAPWLALDVPPPAWWLTGAYYAAAFALLHARTRRIGAACLAAAAAVMLIGPAATSRDSVPPPAMPLRVVVLDVGQGDATIVSLPDRRTLLVDAGGLAPLSPSPDDEPPAFDIGERVVTPALRALGVRQIDSVVITHGDPDHLLGARGVLRHMHAASVWEGVPVPPHPGLRALSAIARIRSMPWRTVQAGDVERYGEIEVRILHPPLPEWERQRVRNEDSVVLDVRAGKVSIVLPGDVGQEGERAIRPRFEEGRVVILKAPHHGSATSSSQELLDALRPRAVIFSCGRDNRFGHPHPLVVERYRAMGVQMFSTASDGAVFVETDGRVVEVRGWRSGRRAHFGLGTGE